MIGRTLSHYKILEKLGSGGMGDVYLAEDTKLSRKVALKVLPSDVAENAERRMRFEREAKAVAALNHPNIVTIHSVEEAEGIHFYTMEHVAGKTLTDLIPKQGMPVRRIFEIAIPLSDAISTAHEKGITHRDLKPANIMMSDEGRLKILDFGLAKLKQESVDSADSELPTRTATQEGRILGTAAYMSPEQAEGKTVDHRSDIFSLGIILYEMATGRRPFQGDTTASILSSIIKDQPQSVTELNPGLPKALSRVIRICLVKDPDHRYQTAKDIRNELEELKQEADSGEALEKEAAPPRAKTRRWLTSVVAAGIATLGIAAFFLLRPESVPQADIFTRLTAQPGQERWPRISPDGKSVVYASDAEGNDSETGEDRRLAPSPPANLNAGSFSPDGRHIYTSKVERDADIWLLTMK